MTVSPTLNQDQRALLAEAVAAGGEIDISTTESGRAGAAEALHRMGLLSTGDRRIENLRDSEPTRHLLLTEAGHKAAARLGLTDRMNEI